MFTLAILVGLYSYIIFGIGLLGYLYGSNIFFVTYLFALVVICLYRKSISTNLVQSFKALKSIKKGIIQLIVKNKLSAICLLVLILQGLVNLVGALGPELGFDALWYHLTIPKIYLQNHSIFYIPGGLFYYSAMPKLTEMLYIAGLAFGSEIFPKLIHFSFGILSLIALYNLSRKFLSKTFSLLVLVLFYSNLVVGWMSITAYVDLTRTFFEIMALWGFVNFVEKKENKRLILSAVLLGLAISTKLLALGSLIIFVLLLFVFVRKITSMLVFLLISLVIPLPWLIFAYIYTGSPVYPFFSSGYPISFNLSIINPLALSDPISPLYIIFIPIAALSYRKFSIRLRLILLYSFLAIIIWYLTPQTGGGRFILPYLPAVSVLVLVIISINKKIRLHYVFVCAIITFAIFSIFYRGVANFKYLPVVLGKVSKPQFLSKHLNFKFGDFYDMDGYFSKHIKSEDKVLLYGFHNLYYVSFPFVDSTYIRKGEEFNYIAVKGNNLPKRFKWWNLIYYNRKTDTKLYSIGKAKWTY